MEPLVLTKQLNMDEKLSLLIGKDDWNTVNIDRLSIPSVTVSDGPHGLRKVYNDENGNRRSYPSTCFPTASAMAATWNTDLVREIGTALGEECRSLGVDILLGPAVNLKRTPLCGRNFEYFSEDPLLAGELAAAYIEGVQSRGVGTALKHFAANNQEYDRTHVSSEIDERTLREIYLKPFEIAVKKARPWTIMCAYNRLNGIYCGENARLLKEILRDEWGFSGFVMSDWGAVHDRVKSLKASLELEMPASRTGYAALKEALENGRLAEEDVDSAVERLLGIIVKVRENRGVAAKAYDAREHAGLAKKAALEAVTLLKNDDRILPIRKGRIRSVAVIGEYARTPIIQGGGSAQVHTGTAASALDRIGELAGNDTEIRFAPAHLVSHHLPAVDDLGDALDAAANCDMAVVFVGNNPVIETEGYDRLSLRLQPQLESIIHRVADQNPNTVVVVQAGSAVDMSGWIGKVKAVVYSWFAGQEGGSAVAEILFGVSNPCGKTAETFPLGLEDTPAYATYPGNGRAAWYAEGLMVGYRYYDSTGKAVLFPFGHGLSYTNFEYTDLNIRPEIITGKETAKARIRIKNVGETAGKEIVQLYIKDTACKVLRPEKELKAFVKLCLEPGEEKEAVMELNREAFAYYNTSLSEWHVRSGTYQVLVGASSRDIRAKCTINVVADNDYS